jgi:hypothetical protein
MLEPERFEPAAFLLPVYNKQNLLFVFNLFYKLIKGYSEPPYDLAKEQPLDIHLHQ